MSSQQTSTLAGVLTHSAGYPSPNNRKMDRVFKQSVGQQAMPSYMSHGGRRSNGGGDYMMVYHQAPEPTHYRTMSGNGEVDEYDFVPPTIRPNYRYGRMPGRRRGRASFMGNGGRYAGPRHQIMRGPPMFNDQMPVRRSYTRRESTHRRSFRNSERYNSVNQTYPSNPQPFEQRPKQPQQNRRRFRSSRGQVSQSEAPVQQPVNENRPRRRRRRTASEIKPSEHSESVRTSRRVTCSICSQVFRSDAMRIRHMRVFHPRRRHFACKECKGVFTSARSITVHLSKPHPTEKEPVAEAKTKAQPGVPIRYLTANTTVFSCKYCPFGFLTANDAQSHQTRCRASQSFKLTLDVEYPGNEHYMIYCMCCPELLTVRQGMLDHYKCLHPFVNLDISYSCVVCSKKFINESDAEKHFNEHADSLEWTKIQEERKDQFVQESLKSYEVQRPVSMVRVKSDVRQVINKMLRQVSRKTRTTSNV